MENRPGKEACLRWLRNWNPRLADFFVHLENLYVLVACEMPVATQRVAGTPDAILLCRKTGSLVILDWKTTPIETVWLPHENQLENRAAIRVPNCKVYRHFAQTMVYAEILQRSSNRSKWTESGLLSRLQFNREEGECQLMLAYVPTTFGSFHVIHAVPDRDATKSDWYVLHPTCRDWLQCNQDHDDPNRTEVTKPASYIDLVHVLDDASDANSDGDDDDDDNSGSGSSNSGSGSSNSGSGSSNSGSNDDDDDKD